MSVPAGTHFKATCGDCGHTYRVVLRRAYRSLGDVMLPPCPLCGRRNRRQKAPSRASQPTQEARQ